MTRKEKSNELQNALKFLFEAGELKRVKRSGWWYAKIRNPESVAEHSFRAAVVAFVIAKGEGVDAERAAVNALFHDFRETRLEDRHKIQTRYFKTPAGAKRRVVREQAALLPANARKDFLEYSSDANPVVKDADLLETALQAREYYDLGFKDCWDWVERAGKLLRTKTAKKLFSELKRTPSGVWWRGLKESTNSVRRGLKEDLA